MYYAVAKDANALYVGCTCIILGRYKTIFHIYFFKFLQSVQVYRCSAENYMTHFFVKRCMYIVSPNLPESGMIGFVYMCKVV